MGKRRRCGMGPDQNGAYTITGECPAKTSLTLPAERTCSPASVAVCLQDRRVAGILMCSGFKASLRRLRWSQARMCQGVLN